ncbi:hypothetical protein [Polaribacter sargassicola]|uniref:hypothetical protein n=1 Tax=Polaribacter sargassicola TaxID=2836891 RepID=UPI001F30440C|nr:hypothetical protein [Polaribacter sp. DS7-9]MCG1034837.1 hypothetical protein [Polaribacter sp. DS7-9]
MNNKLEGIIINHEPISESYLKRLLLIFDTIYFLDPIENNVLIPAEVSTINYGKMTITGYEYGILYNGENFQNQEEELLDKFNYATSKGIIKILDIRLRKFYHKNWLPLRLAYDFDTGNAELLNTFLPLLKREENISRKTGIFRGGFISPSGVKLYPDIPKSVNFFDDKENEKFALDHQLYSITARIDKGLAVCAEFDLIPIFTDNQIAKAYSFKNEIAKKNVDKNVNEKFESQYGKEINNVQYLLHKISQVILTDEVLAEISVKELIIARQNSFQECMKLRRKLLQAISFLENSDFDNNFIKEVDNYISKEIEPLLSKYQIEFLKNLNRFLNQAIPFGTAVIGASIGIQENLTPMATAYLSGISAIVGNYSSNLVDYAIKKPSKKLNNTFSYFINLRE